MFSPFYKLEIIIIKIGALHVGIIDMEIYCFKLANLSLALQRLAYDKSAPAE